MHIYWMKGIAIIHLGSSVHYVDSVSVIHLLYLLFWIWDVHVSAFLFLTLLNANVSKHQTSKCCCETVSDDLMLYSVSVIVRWESW